jgi:hypothetical protein
MIATLLRYFAEICLEEPNKNHVSVWIANGSGGIRMGHFPNKILKCYHYIILLVAVDSDEDIGKITECLPRLQN